MLNLLFISPSSCSLFRSSVAKHTNNTNIKSLMLISTSALEPEQVSSVSLAWLSWGRPGFESWLFPWEMYLLKSKWETRATKWNILPPGQMAQAGGSLTMVHEVVVLILHQHLAGFYLFIYPHQGRWSKHKDDKIHNILIPNILDDKIIYVDSGKPISVLATPTFNWSPLKFE